MRPGAEGALWARLEQYAASGALPMHMPGHKRAPGRFPALSALGAGLDVTEIEGFDNLHRAQGVLRGEMEAAAALWGAGRTFYLVNGSTCGLLAAIHALGAGGGRAIVARNSHRAVHHGLELCGLAADWLVPPWCASLGVYGSVTPGQVAQALARSPDARFVLLTSPTYEGVMSDIAAIAPLCRRAGVPLIVDQAHGAHLGFGGFPPGAVSQGADLVVHSAHKTLPSLTQTALLHLGRDAHVDARALERSLSIFESSSPSYLLLASLSGCTAWLSSPEALGPWRAGLTAFRRRTRRLRRIRVVGCPPAGEHRARSRRPSSRPGPDAALPPEVWAWEESKLLLLPGGAGYSGHGLMEALRRRFAIELEMAQPHLALAMTGAGDDKASLTRLAHALLALDGEDGGEAPGPLPPAPPPLPPARMTMGQAMAAPARHVPLSQARGRVCAQYLWTYPPGVPLAVPGEELTAPPLDWLEALERRGMRLEPSPRAPRGTVRVVE